MNNELSKAEKFYRKSMGVLALMFLIGAVLFGLLPDHLLRVLNWTGAFLNMNQPLVHSQITVNAEQFNQIQKDVKPQQQFKEGTKGIPGDRLWVGMSVTMMVMIFFIAFMNFVNPRKYMGWVPILLVSKFTTSALGFAYFFTAPTYKYLSALIMPITDLPIFFFILVIWLRARSSKNKFDPPEPETVDDDVPEPDEGDSEE